MQTPANNAILMEGYMRLLESLSANQKLDLITRLTDSVKEDVENKKAAFFDAFGAWDNEQSAEELINTIRNSRSFNREIEEL